MRAKKKERVDNGLDLSIASDLNVKTIQELNADLNKALNVSIPSDLNVETIHALNADLNKAKAEAQLIVLKNTQNTLDAVKKFSIKVKSLLLKRFRLSKNKNNAHIKCDKIKM